MFRRSSDSKDFGDYNFLSLNLIAQTTCITPHHVDTVLKSYGMGRPWHRNMKLIQAFIHLLRLHISFSHNLHLKIRYHFWVLHLLSTISRRSLVVPLAFDGSLVMIDVPEFGQAKNEEESFFIFLGLKPI